MSVSPLTRRALIGGLAGAAAFPAIADGREPTRRLDPGLARSLRLSRISLVRGRFAGDGTYRGIFERALMSELSLVFADRMGGQARLAVHVDRIMMNSDIPGRISNNAVTGSSWDYVEGAASVLAGNGAPMGHYRILATSAADAAGAWYAPDAELRRLDYLGRNFARWVRRVTLG
jgi:hypothetical protein